MEKQDRFLVDVGMTDLPFPIRVLSKEDPKGQHTVANISIHARIMREFEARWIDKFIQVLHSHRESIGTSTLRENIQDYLKELSASMVRIDFDYPFFIEKLTPVSKEKCLVRYHCRFSAKSNSVDAAPRVIFKISVPVITTYPVSGKEEKGGLFAQTSIVDLEVESHKEIHPEDLVAVVDSHALCPVYSFLSEADQNFLVHKTHSEKRTSVVMIDEIKNVMAHNKDINWYQVRCSNFGMLHSYNTVIGTEKNMWVPFSGYEE